MFTHEEGVLPTTQTEVLESSLRSGEGHSATDDFLPDVVPEQQCFLFLKFIYYVFICCTAWHARC